MKRVTDDSDSQVMPRHASNDLLDVDWLQLPRRFHSRGACGCHHQQFFHVDCKLHMPPPPRWLALLGAALLISAAHASETMTTPVREDDPECIHDQIMKTVQVVTSTQDYDNHPFAAKKTTAAPPHDGRT
ncbi:Aste57867_9271 [Aphanomyces stellatus]|uniref:Aste57867_9271 protein n=1 Tax=Aphanomyces stellatus TaxID=120398 RepID=A0A485KMG7_9STRA|nr:hypothetical protein As57867_009235 [Aphanomyces stellatus]VFT86154.1 Aste57867_9271 [Aphanomyces stellatus]